MLALSHVTYSHFLFNKNCCLAGIQTKQKLGQNLSLNWEIQTGGLCQTHHATKIKTKDTIIIYSLPACSQVILVTTLARWSTLVQGMKNWGMMGRLRRTLQGHTSDNMIHTCVDDPLQEKNKPGRQDGRLHGKKKKYYCRKLHCDAGRAVILYM